MAASCSTTSVVSYLIEHGATPNLGPAIGPGIGSISARKMVLTSGKVLHAAVRSNTTEMVDFLLSKGAKLSNASILHEAVYSKRIEMVQHVINIPGVDINELDRVQTMGGNCIGTPLLRAILVKSVDLVRLLLENGADITIQGHTMHGVPVNALGLIDSDNFSSEFKELVENAVKKRQSEGFGIGMERLGSWLSQALTLD